MSLAREELKTIPKIGDVYHPGSIEEVQQIIIAARKHKLSIRTLGSLHSPASSIYSDSAKQLKIKLDGKFRDVNSFEVDETKESARVTVGAGCYLGVNPSDKTSTRENSFNYQVDKQGYALPTLGGITHQTIAGFLLTSSSGGSAKYNIADYIEEFGFVDGTGTYQHVKKGDEIFDAFGVSMGLLGIMTDVTFCLPKRYLVEGSEINQEVKDSCLAGDSKSGYAALDKVLFEENDYAHVNWFAQKYVDRLSLWTGHQTYDFLLPQNAYKHALSSKGMSFLASSILRKTNRLNEKVGDIDEAQKVIAAMLKPFVNPKDKQEFRDIWYQTLPIDDQADVDGLFDIKFSEMWFPRGQLNEVMHRCKYLFETNPKAAGNFIVELYSAKQSPFWMSPSYGHDAIRVDLYWWDKNPCGNANQYFGQFYEAFNDVPGIRYHWGKNLPHPGEKYGNYIFDVKDLQKNYPKLKDFLKLREDLDPQQLFVTDYWRALLTIPAVTPEKTWLNTAANFVETCASLVTFGMFSKKPVNEKSSVDVTSKISPQ